MLDIFFLIQLSGRKWPPWNRAFKERDGNTYYVHYLLIFTLSKQDTQHVYRLTDRICMLPHANSPLSGNLIYWFEIIRGRKF